MLEGPQGKKRLRDKSSHPLNIEERVMSSVHKQGIAVLKI